MHLVRLPRLGQTMESGIINLWFVDEGASFSLGDPLYEVETEKMNTEVEARQNGVLARIVVAAGSDEVPVGAVLGVIADTGEAVDDSAIDALLGLEAMDRAEDEAPSLHPESTATPPAEPQAPRLNAEDELQAGGAGSPTRILAVPKARFLARERGIDLANVPGSGQGGVIRVSDVLGANGARTPATAPLADHDYVGPPLVSERIPLRGVAKSMAEAMTRSWSDIPQFVQQINCNATALVARLKRLRYEGLRVTYTDLFVSAVAITASEVPEVNSTFAGDEIIRYADVNVSVAVATDRGLLVPVVRRAHARSIGEIAATTKDLAERARNDKLTIQDITDGTITVSNLGAFGIDTGTPIVNGPQCAIVFLGSLTDQAVVSEGQVIVQPRLNIAIAYDHRVVDGVTAAGFTSSLRTRLEAGG